MCTADVIPMHTRYVDTMNVHAREGKQHSISRSFIVQDVLVLHSAEAACSEYPLLVGFMDERGLVFGGVTRHMYSAFWASAMFDPTNAGWNGSDYFIKFGRLLARGFLTCQMLHICIALKLVT